jgi:dUTP pyrophosphatase
MKVKIKKLCEEAIVPSYAKPGDAGLDLTAVSKIYDKYGNVSYGTGLAFEIPEGHVGLLFPRSSVSKTTISLANSVGVIDSGYRGEVMVKFKPTCAYFNELGKDSEDGLTFDTCDAVKDDENVDYNIGDKVCQLIIMPFPKVEISEVEELSDTERGEGGFGSTGK